MSVIYSESFAARLAQGNFIAKIDFNAKLSNFNKKFTSNKTKNLLVEDEFKKWEIFDSIYFRGKGHFEDDGTPNYLVFQAAYRYFKTVSINDSDILSWKSKGLSDESIKHPSSSNKTLNPSVDYLDTKARVKFNGDCLKKDKISFDHGKVIMK